LRYERDARNRVAAIRVSTGRVRRLKFAKIAATGG
jgi:hypothetical protein